MLRSFLISVILLSFVLSGVNVKAADNTLNRLLENTSYNNQNHNHPTNTIGVNTLGLIGKSVVVNYEHLFADRHGIFIEAGVDANGGYGYQLAYLLHSTTHKSKKGLLAPSWGPFIRLSKATTEFEDKDIDQKYEMDIESLNIGLQMSRSYSLGEHFRLNWRFGYGLPVNTKFNWDDNSFKDKKMMEDFTRVFIGLEGGLTLGYVF